MISIDDYWKKFVEATNTPEQLEPHLRLIFDAGVEAGIVAVVTSESDDEFNTLYQTILLPKAGILVA